jgi:hypothetical protein
MRPTLIVGDIQGDFERLEEALSDYPESEYDTVFLGDFFQGGRLGAAGGMRAAQIARTRRNSRSVLGNHDLFILVVLAVHRGELPEDVMKFANMPIEDFWLARRGDRADLEALQADPDLQIWLRSLPFMLLLDDGTLVQHCDSDDYRRIGASVDAVNRRVATWLTSNWGLVRATRYLLGRRAFNSEQRLNDYLGHFGARRLVHGHTPHWGDAPESQWGGRLLGYDGRFSRYWGRREDETFGPVGATIGLLPA